MPEPLNEFVGRMTTNLVSTYSNLVEDGERFDDLNALREGLQVTIRGILESASYHPEPEELTRIIANVTDGVEGKVNDLLRRRLS